MWLKNNKEITENTITTVYFLFADHNIQDSAQLEEKNQTTNQHPHPTLPHHPKKTQTKHLQVCMHPDSWENFPPHI